MFSTVNTRATLQVTLYIEVMWIDFNLLRLKIVALCAPVEVPKIL